MLRIRKLLWNDENENHLWASHGVLPIEVDEVVFGVDDEDPDYRDERDGSVIYGATGDGRLLVLVIALEPISPGYFRPFAAREMEPDERRKYRNRKRTR